MRERKRTEGWEVGQYKYLGLRDAGSAIKKKGRVHPQVLLFLDMDRSTMSLAEGRAGGLCGLRKDAAYHQATPQP